MKFIAQWGIYAYPTSYAKPETRYESEPVTFEKDGKDAKASIRAAKAHVTKLVSADDNMQELIEDKWGYGPYPPDWDAWGETANNYMRPGWLHSLKLSRTESESNGKFSSTRIQAKIYLHWQTNEKEI